MSSFACLLFMHLYHFIYFFFSRSYVLRSFSKCKHQCRSFLCVALFSLHFGWVIFSLFRFIISVPFSFSLVYFFLPHRQKVHFSYLKGIVIFRWHLFGSVCRKWQAIWCIKRFPSLGMEEKNSHQHNKHEYEVVLARAPNACRPQQHRRLIQTFFTRLSIRNNVQHQHVLRHPVQCYKTRACVLSFGFTKMRSISR